MWYPIVFVLSIFLILMIVIRRALVLGFDEDVATSDDRPLGKTVDLPQNPGDARDVSDKWAKAEQLYKDKKFFAAEKWYKDVIHSQPENDKAWARLGTIALGQKRYKPAVENLEKSVEINSNVPSRHYNLALAYFLDGNQDHALASINVALKSDSQKANYLELKRNIEKMHY